LSAALAHGALQLAPARSANHYNDELQNNGELQNAESRMKAQRFSAAILNASQSGKSHALQD